jgi:hypothetical protein
VRGEPKIEAYSEILREAREADGVGASLCAAVHALCAIGLDLAEISQTLSLMLIESGGDPFAKETPS